MLWGWGKESQLWEVMRKSTVNKGKGCYADLSWTPSPLTNL